MRDDRSPSRRPDSPTADDESTRKWLAQRSATAAWNERIDAVREDIESKKTAHDVGKARRKADRAEEDAMLAIDAAYWAIDEADYAVLDAVLARMDADDAAAAAGEAP